MAYGTMEKIETVTVGAGGTAAITFSNIPQTFDDLVLFTSFRGETAGSWQNINLTFNGSSTGYVTRLLYASGGTTVGSDSVSGSMIKYFYANYSTSTANTFSNGQIYIPNYKTSNNKSVSLDSVTETNGTATILALSAGVWSNSAAITSMSLVSEIGGNWAQYSTATLYGITRVPAGAKATGGVITDDASYWYHTFTSTGTFTPSSNLSCEYLVIAGGGGAGSYGGGGGAGGLLNGTGLSVTATTNYTVTVGAGGAGGSGGTFGTVGNNSSFSIVTANGGGRGGSLATNGGDGGSGGGGGMNDQNSSTSGGAGNTPSTTPSQGNNGGTGSGQFGGVTRGSGGGGGAGAVGGNGSSDDAGNGGAGSSTYSSWGLATGTGHDVSGTRWFAGGGGGGADSRGASPTAGIGGNGGGANGTITSTAPSNAIANTGGGGGGGTYSGSLGAYVAGSTGGSGIVIVRYAK